MPLTCYVPSQIIPSSSCRQADIEKTHTKLSKNHCLQKSPGRGGGGGGGGFDTWPIDYQREKVGERDRTNVWDRTREITGRETHSKERKTEGEEIDWQRHTERGTEKKVRERQRQRAIAREKESEGGRERGKNMLGTHYATKCTRRCMEWNITPKNQSTFTFYLIKPYQPFNQTRTSTTHNRTTFLLSLYIYSHISHSSQSYGQQ